MSPEKLKLLSTPSSEVRNHPENRPTTTSFFSILHTLIEEKYRFCIEPEFITMTSSYLFGALPSLKYSHLYSTHCVVLNYTILQLDMQTGIHKIEFLKLKPIDNTSSPPQNTGFIQYGFVLIPPLIA